MLVIVIYASVSKNDIKCIEDQIHDIYSRGSPQLEHYYWRCKISFRISPRLMLVNHPLWLRQMSKRRCHKATDTSLHLCWHKRDIVRRSHTNAASWVFERKVLLTNYGPFYERNEMRTRYNHDGLVVLIFFNIDTISFAVILELSPNHSCLHN